MDVTEEVEYYRSQGWSEREAYDLALTAGPGTTPLVGYAPGEWEPMPQPVTTTKTTVSTRQVPITTTQTIVRPGTTTVIPAETYTPPARGSYSSKGISGGYTYYYDVDGQRGNTVAIPTGVEATPEKVLVTPGYTYDVQTTKWVPVTTTSLEIQTRIPVSFPGYKGSPELIPGNTLLRTTPGPVQPSEQPVSSPPSPPPEIVIAPQPQAFTLQPPPTLPHIETPLPSQLQPTPTTPSVTPEPKAAGVMQVPKLTFEKPVPEDKAAQSTEQYTREIVYGYPGGASDEDRPMYGIPAETVTCDMLADFYKENNQNPGSTWRVLRDKGSINDPIFYQRQQEALQWQRSHPVYGDPRYPLDEIYFVRRGDFKYDDNGTQIEVTSDYDVSSLKGMLKACSPSTPEGEKLDVYKPGLKPESLDDCTNKWSVKLNSDGTVPTDKDGSAVAPDAKYFRPRCESDPEAVLSALLNDIYGPTISDPIKDKILEVFKDLIPEMAIGNLNPGVLLELADALVQIDNKALTIYGENIGGGAEAPYAVIEPKDWNSYTEGDKKFILNSIASRAAESGIDPTFVGTALASLVGKTVSGEQRSSLSDYIINPDGLQTALESDTYTKYRQAANSIVSDPNFSMYVGGALALVAVATGLGAGAVAVGTAARTLSLSAASRVLFSQASKVASTALLGWFATTEMKNLQNGNFWRERQQQLAEGTYPEQEVRDHKEAFGGLEKEAAFLEDNPCDAQGRKKWGDYNRLYNKLVSDGCDLCAKMPSFKHLNEWNEQWRQFESARQSLQAFRNLPCTKAEQSQPETLPVVPCEGADLYVEGEKVDLVDGKYNITVPVSGYIEYTVKKEGYEDDIQTRYWDGKQDTLPEANPCPRKEKFKKTPPEFKDQQEAVITYGDCFDAFTLNGEEWFGKSGNPRFFDTSNQVLIGFKEGKEVARTTFYPKAGEGPIEVRLECPKPSESYIPYSGGPGGGGGATPGGKQPTLIAYGETIRGYEKILFDTVQVYPEIMVDYGVTSGYHVVRVEMPSSLGYTPWEKQIMFPAGKRTEVNAQFKGGTTTAYEPYTPYEKPSERTTIQWGDSCAGTRTYFDDTEVFPVLNTEYDVTPGYHSVIVQKAGYKDWFKTVYIGQGDTISISPYLDPLTTPKSPATGTTTIPTAFRVWFNTEPIGAKIVVDGSWSGQWTPGYIDLEPGFYEVCCMKSGYEEECTSVLVTDQVLYGEAARQQYELMT